MAHNQPDFDTLDMLLKSILEMSCRQRIYEAALMALIQTASSKEKKACAAAARVAAITMLDANAVKIDAEGDAYITQVLSDFLQTIKGAPAR